MLSGLNFFEKTIDYWIKALDSFSFSELLTKPSADSWSLGQVYMHLIENTDWFFEQVNICLSSNANANKEPSADGKEMLRNNSFPDARLDGPPENDLTPQPHSKEEISEELMRQKREAKRMKELILTGLYQGRTKHPGLGFFDAAEWFQFAEMHLRHHIRQKKRIEEFLEELPKG